MANAALKSRVVSSCTKKPYLKVIAALKSKVVSYCTKKARDQKEPDLDMTLSQVLIWKKPIGWNLEDPIYPPLNYNRLVLCLESEVASKAKPTKKKTPPPTHCDELQEFLNHNVDKSVVRFFRNYHYQFKLGTTSNYKLIQKIYRPTVYIQCLVPIHFINKKHYEKIEH